MRRFIELLTKGARTVSRWTHTVLLGIGGLVFPRLGRLISSPINEDTTFIGSSYTLTAACKQYWNLTQDINPGTSDFSFEFWAKRAAIDANGGVVYTGAGGNGQDGFTISFTSANKIQLMLNDSVQATRIVSSIGTYTFDTNWHHVVVNYDRNGNAEVFVDNASIGTVDISAHQATLETHSPGNNRIGVYAVSAYYFNGSLAALRYRTRLMTAGEITSSYNLGNGKYYNDLSVDEKVGLVHAWDCLEQAGVSATTLYDSVGTNHGTQTNANIISSTLLNGGFTTRTGRTWANFIANDKTHLECADNAALDLDTGDIFLTASVYRSSTGNQIVASKYQDADNYWKIEINSSHYVRFFARASGADEIDVVCSTTALSSISTAYYIAVLIDRSNSANTKIYINNVSQSFSTNTVSTDTIANSGKFYIGQLGDNTLYWDGRICQVGIGKPVDYATVGGLAACQLAAGTTLYNSALGQYYAEVSSADRTTLGITAYWDLTEPYFDSTHTATDMVSTNDLTFTPSNMLSNPGFETRMGRTWASFAASDKAHLEAADDAALDLSDDDFALLGSIRRDSTGNQVIASKYQDANNYWKWELDAAHKQHFYATKQESVFDFVAADKSDFRIADASHTGLDLGVSDGTITGYVYFDSVAAGEECVVHKGGDSDANEGIEVYRDTTSLKAAISNGTTRVVITIGTVAATTWYHFAIVFDRDGNATGYLDSVAGTPQAISGIPETVSNSIDFCVGSRNAADWFAGRLACVKFYSRVLSSDEITADYNNGYPLYYSTLTTAQKVDLVSCWDCRDGAGTTCTDMVGTNNLTMFAEELLTNGDFETRAGRTWALMESADKAYFDVADTDDLDLSTGDIFLTATVYRTTTGNQVIASKYEDSDNYWMWEIDASDILHFIAYKSGVKKIEVWGTTALSSTSTAYTCALVVDRDSWANTKLWLNGVDDTRGKVELLSNTGFETRVGRTAASLVATDKAYFTATSNIDPGTSDFSFEGWVQLTSIGSTQVVIRTGATANGSDGFLLGIDGSTNKLWLALNDSVQGTRIDSRVGTYTFDTNWHYIVVNFDRDGNAMVYVDNVSIGTVDISGHQASLGAAVDSIIGSGLTSTWFCNGSLAALRYRTRLMTTDEITSSYNSGLGKYYNELTTDEKIGVVHAWDMTEPSGTRADLAGVNHLTETFAEMLSNTGFETRAGRTWANLTAACKEYFDCANDSALNLGTGDFFLTASVYRTTTGNQIIASKYQDADNYWKLEINSSHYVRFFARASAADEIDIVCSTTALSSTSTAYHIALLVDRSDSANTKVYVNGVSQSFSTNTVSTDTIDNTGSIYAGQLGDGTLYWDGRIAQVGIGKITDYGADLAACQTAAGTTIYNSGVGKYYNEISSANKTTLGLASGAYWDMTESSGTRADSVGSNDLLEKHTDIISPTLLNGGFETRTGRIYGRFVNTNKAYLYCASDAALNLGTGDFILTTSLKRGGSGGMRTICSKYQDATNYWRLAMNIDKVEFVAVNAGAGGNITLRTSGTFASTTVPYNIVVAVDRDTVANSKIYVNGVSEALETASDDGNTIDNTGDFNLGVTWSGSSYYIHGYMCQVGIGKVADVTAAAVGSAVSTLYNSGLGMYYNEAEAADVHTDLGLTVWWDVSQPEYNSTTTCTDMVGSNDLSFAALEMITNGGFADGTSWTSTYDGEGAGISGGTLNAIFAGDNDPTTVTCYTAAVTAAGFQYALQFDSTKNSGASVYCKINASTDPTQVSKGYDAVVADSGTTNTTFWCTATGNYIHFYATNSAAGDTDIDNVSLKVNHIISISDADLVGSWTETTASNSRVGIETIGPQTGNYSLRIYEDETGAAASISQAVLVVGKTYDYSIQSKGSAASKTYTVYAGTATATETADDGAFGEETGSLTCTDNTTFKIESLSATTSLLYFDSITLTCTSVIPCISDTDLFGSWTESKAGTSTYEVETVSPQTGNCSLRITEDSSGNAVSISQSVLTVGRTYNYSIQSKGSAADKTYTVYAGTATATETADNGSFGEETGTLICVDTTAFKIESLSATSATLYFDTISCKATSIPCTSETDIFGSWTEAKAGTSTYDIETASTQAGACALRMAEDSSGNAVSIAQDVLTVGRTYYYTIQSKGSAADKTYRVYAGTNTADETADDSAFGEESGYIDCADNTTFKIESLSATSAFLYFDTISIKEAPYITADDISNAGKLYIGQSGIDTLHLNGKIAQIGLGKPSDGGSVAAQLAASTTTYNSGIGKYYNEYSVGNKSDLGITAFWDMTEVSGTRADAVGSNDLIERHSALISPTILNGGFETRTGRSWASFVATDKASLYGAADVNPGIQDFSFSASIKPTSLDTTGYIIYTGANADDQNGFCMLLNTSGRIHVYINDSVEATRAGGYFNTTLSINTAYHLVVTIDRDGLMKLYVNGSIDSTTFDVSAHTDILGNMHYFQIGTRGGSACASGFTGYISQVQYWEGVVLDQDTVTSLYNSGLGKYYNELTAGEKTGLVAAWDLTQQVYNSTTTATDMVGTNHLVFTAGELVTNGTFDANIDGWTNHATYTWDTAEWDATGKAHVVNNGDGTPASCTLYQAVSTIVGKTYTIAYDVTKTAGGIIARYSTDAIGSVSAGYSVTHTTTASVTNGSFVSTTAEGSIHFRYTNVAENNWLIDNVSLKSASIPCVSDADVFGSWSESASGTSRVNDETVAPYDGSHACRLDVDGSGSLVYIGQTVEVVGKTYTSTAWVKSDSGTPSIRFYAGGTAGTSQAITTTYTQYTDTLTCTSSGLFFITRSSATSKSIYIDNVTLTCTSSITSISDTDLFSSWTETSSGTSTYAVETASPQAGSNSIRILEDSSGNAVKLSQDVLTVGRNYNYSIQSKGSGAGLTYKVCAGTTTVNDSIGTNDGTLTGFSDAQKVSAWSSDVPTPLAGDGEWSLTFNGVENYVLATKREDMAVGSAFSVSLWVKCAAGGCAFANTIAGAASRFSINILVGLVRAGLYSTAATAYLDPKSGGSIGDSVWHHIVVTNSAANAMGLYIDTAVQSGTTLTTVANVVGLTIGARTSGATPFAGNIKDVRIYSTALSAPEVAELYTGSEVTGKTPVAQWEFNEGSSILSETADNGTFGEETGTLTCVTDGLFSIETLASTSSTLYFDTISCKASEIPSETITFKAAVDITGTTALSNTSANYALGVIVDRTSSANTKLYTNGANDTASSSSCVVDISNTGKLYIGQLGDDTLYFNGRLCQLGIAKPTDASAVAVTTAVANYYAGGIGEYYNEISATDKSALSLSAFWDLTQRSYSATSDAVDMVGSNDLNFIDGLPGTTSIACVSDTDMFASWSETLSGTSTIEVETVSPQANNCSLRFYEDSSGNPISVSQSLLTTGKNYSYSISSKADAADKTYTVYAGTASSTETADNGSFGAETGTLTCADNAVFKIESLASTSSPLYLDTISLLCDHIKCVSDADVFGTWTEAVSGTGSVDVDTTNVRTGTCGARYNAGTISYIYTYQNILVTGKSYVSSIYAKKIDGAPSLRAEFGSVASDVLTDSYVEYTSTQTATGGIIYIGTYSDDTSLVIDDVTLYCNSPIPNGNGPAQALASDTIGTYHGTLTGYTSSQLITSWSSDVPTPLAGADQFSLTFDGVDDYITRSVAFRGSDYSGSVSVWFKTTSSGMLFSSGTTSSSTNYINMGMNANGSLYIAQRNSDDPGTVNTIATGYNDGEWHHAVFVSTGTAYLIYVDGASKTLDSSGNGDWFADTSIRTNIAIGAHVTTTVLSLFTGKLKDVRVYSDVLSLSQVGELYAGGEATSATPVAQFEMNDGYQGEPANGDSVLSMISSEGSYYQFISSTLSQLPVYTIPIFGTYAGLTFDGLDDRLVYTGSLSTATEGSAGFVIETSSAFSADQVFFSTADTATANYWLQFGIDSTGYVFVEANDGGVVTRATTTNVLVVGTTYVIIISSNGDSYDIIINRTTETLTGTNNGKWFGDIAGRDNVVLGCCVYSSAARFFGGVMGDFKLYTYCLEEGNKRRLFNYFNLYYSLGL